MATTTAIYDNITFLLQPVSPTSSPLRPEGADSPTVLSSQRMRMRRESADSQVGSRAQPPVEARARTLRVRKATAEPRSPTDAAGNWRRNASRGGGPRQRGHRRATTHATVLTAKKAGGPVGPVAVRTPTEVATDTGHPQHGGPVDSTMRSAGSAANQPRDQPTMGTPRVHPAEVAPGDVMRKYRLRAARNKRIAAWHSR